MKIRKFSSIEEWKVWRLGKITGSRLKDIISKNGRKVESYALIAESWIGSAALAEEEESAELAMQRGKRLEPEAIQRFKDETGKKVVWHNDDIGWESDGDNRIALSPDASIGITEAVEAKCLAAKRHIEVRITNKIPADHNYQKLQYFITNEKLRKLYFVFYHPLFPKGLDYFVIEVNRKDIKDEIAAALKYQQDELKWVREQVADLTKYVQNPIEAEPIAAQETTDEELDSALITIMEASVQESSLESLERIAAGIKDRAYD